MPREVNPGKKWVKRTESGRIGGKFPGGGVGSREGERAGRAEGGRIDGKFPGVLLLGYNDKGRRHHPGDGEAWSCHGRITRRHEDPRNQPDHRPEPPLGFMATRGNPIGGEGYYYWYYTLPQPGQGDELLLGMVFILLKWEKIPLK